MPRRHSSGYAGTRLQDLPATFWWLWFAELVIWIGRFVVPFMSIYLTSTEGLSATTAGVVVAGYGVGMMISGLYGGILADRFGRKRTAAVSLLSSAAVLVAIPFSGSTALTSALLIVYGLFNGACQPVIVTMIGDLVEAAHRRMAFNYSSWAVNMGYAIGPVVAGLMAERRFELLFFAQAIVLVIAFAIVALKIPETHGEIALASLPGGTGQASPKQPQPVPLDSDPERTPAGKAARPAAGGLLDVLKDRPFLIFSAIMFLYFLVYVQSTTTLPVVMTQQGLSSAQYGYLLTLNGLLLCLLQIPAARILGRWSREIVIAIAVVITAVGVGLQAAAVSFAMYAVAVCLWTFGELGAHAQAQSVASDMARSPLRGRYQGVYALHFSLAMVIGPVLGGVALDQLGAQVLWLLCGALSITAGVLILVTRSGRRSRLQETAHPLADQRPTVDSATS